MWFGVVFPSCCVLTCIVIGRHYLVLARAAARDADGYADDAHDAAAEVRRRYRKAVDADRLSRADEPDASQQPSADDLPTVVIERVSTPGTEPEAAPVAHTPAQRFRGSGADAGRHRITPSPTPQHRQAAT